MHQLNVQIKKYEDKNYALTLFIYLLDYMSYELRCENADSV